MSACCEIKGKTVPIKIWSRLETVESAALDQLKNIAALPWVAHHVAVMPDVHLGKGATVGSVIAMKEALSPSAVGVDIGCGMAAVRTSLRAEHLPDSLVALRSTIEASIPVGFASHENAGWRDLSSVVVRSVHVLMDDFLNLTPKVADLSGKASRQIGTLGGGNHFIELCVDAEDNVWLMLHSGSRNIGKSIAEVHVKIAKTLDHNARLPDPDLAAFLIGSSEMVAYRHDLKWAQDYAWVNRLAMLEIYQGILSSTWPDIRFHAPINCHHNYATVEEHFGKELFITRKGAISAAQGELGIIPGSMGTASYIVRGLGNPESFCSASHGAGRRMSRGAAKRHFTLEDLATQTKGVECRKDSGVLDEIPGAYKDIDDVMADQDDLVEIVTRLKQVMCVKG